MNIFRRLYLWIRGETPILWECPMCGLNFDVRFAREHLTVHERKK